MVSVHPSGKKKIIHFQHSPHKLGKNGRKINNFDFKNAECQKIFDDVSAGTAIFSALGDEHISVEKRTQGFIQNLNELFMKTLRKI